MRSSAESLELIRLKMGLWLRQGISPQRLALTLALGFVIGCFPLMGLPTALCAIVALTFRLNQPAIQVANYAAMPFQVALLIPLVRLGGKLWSPASKPTGDFAALLHPPMQLAGHSTEWVMQLGGMAGQAVLAWFLIAIPVVALLTATLTILLRRVPALAQSEERELA